MIEAEAENSSRSGRGLASGQRHTLRLRRMQFLCVHEAVVQLYPEGHTSKHHLKPTAEYLPKSSAPAALAHGGSGGSIIAPADVELRAEGVETVASRVGER